MTHTVLGFADKICILIVSAVICCLSKGHFGTMPLPTVLLWVLLTHIPTCFASVLNERRYTMDTVVSVALVVGFVCFAIGIVVGVVAKHFYPRFYKWFMELGEEKPKQSSSPIVRRDEEGVEPARPKKVKKSPRERIPKNVEVIQENSSDLDVTPKPIPPKKIARGESDGEAIDEEVVVKPPMSPVRKKKSLAETEEKDADEDVAIAPKSPPVVKIRRSRENRSKNKAARMKKKPRS